MDGCGGTTLNLWAVYNDNSGLAREFTGPEKKDFRVTLKCIRERKRSLTM